jgi:hypothetical protein
VERLLSDRERQVLLALAREAIRAHLTGGEPRKPEAAGGLARRAGAFVTLRQAEHLRGCIGHLEADLTLVDVVARAAVSAATSDPRFPPMTLAEVDATRVEISVLGPFVPVERPSSIEVGRHGLLVQSGWRKGLLLPQVPGEWGWNREEFLAHTCLKAGLAAESWKRGVELFVFEAEVFGEDF